MSLSRAELAAKLWGRLQRPFAEVGIANADTSGNLMEPLDDTLAALGLEDDGVVPDDNKTKAIALAVYYGWEAIVRAFIDMDDQVDAPNIHIVNSKQGDRYEKQRDLALQTAAPYLPDDGSFSSGTINLGFISTETEVWA
jgi:hypothetical protein